MADEVQRQLAVERSETQTLVQNSAPDSGGGAPTLFDNGPHVLVVSGDLDITDATGQECFVTQGDVLGMNGAPPQGASAATVRIMASKGSTRGQACARGIMVSVALEDLVEMQSHARDAAQGLAQLRTQHGHGGLPACPAAASGPIASPVADAMPQPDPGGNAELKAQEQEANRAERQVITEAVRSDAAAQLVPEPETSMPQPGAPSTAQLSTAAPAIAQSPKTISMGQTPDEVIAILGKPDRIVDADDKKRTFMGTSR